MCWKGRKMIHKDIRNLVWGRVNPYSNGACLECLKIVDKVYEDFEQRTCKNCNRDYQGCPIQDSIIFTHE